MTALVASEQTSTSLTLGHFLVWLECTPVPSSSVMLGDLLGLPPHVQLETARAFYTAYDPMFEPDLTALSVDATRLSMIADAIVAGEINGFMLQCYPTPLWLLLHPEISTVRAPDFIRNHVNCARRRIAWPDLATDEGQVRGADTVQRKSGTSDVFFAHFPTVKQRPHAASQAVSRLRELTNLEQLLLEGMRAHMIGQFGTAPWPEIAIGEISALGA